MSKNFASVRVEENTYKILKATKENQGIPITEAIRVAVTKVYGKKQKTKEEV